MPLKRNTPNRRRPAQRWIAPTAMFFIVILLWRVTVAVFHVSPAILPSPEKVALAFVANASSLLRNAALTSWEALLGFSVAAIAAISLATLFTFSASSKRALYPYAIGMKSIPLVALAPLVVAWCGGDLTSKVVLAAIISFFPILVSATDGLKTVERDAIDLFRSFSATRWVIFRKLQFPTALPHIFAGLKTASSFAVVGAVVAEFIGARAGVGLMIKSSSYYLDTDITFAATVVAAGIGLLFFGAVGLFQRLFFSCQLTTDSEESEIHSEESTD